MTPRRLSHARRGFTLIELLIAISILAMLSLLIYGAFAGMHRTKVGLERISDRYREGRVAMARISRDLQSAYISAHIPIDVSLTVVSTAFSGKRGTPADRLDFNSFSNVRRDQNSHVSDQAEISYFGSQNPDEPRVTDLVRRISEYPDDEPDRGGRVEVLCTDIELFELEYLDPQTGSWVETWDTTQAAGQPNRLPLQVRINLVLKGGRRPQESYDRDTLQFQTQIALPMQNPLNFATL
jgi:general secretion pathway protein J